MAKLIEITGKALSGEWGIDDVDGTGIPVLRTTNFTNEGIVNYENIVTRKIPKKNIDEKYLIQGDIIIEKSGGSDKQPVGRVVFFEGLEHKYLFNNFTGLLRIKDKDKWEPKYIFYSLYSNYRKGGTKAFENKTTGLHNLKTDDYISRLNIKDTAIEEQRNICRKLDIICKIIKLQQEQLIMLDELIKSRFVEMFDNNDDWDTVNMEDICSDMRTGPFGSALHHDEFVDNGIFVLGIDNAVENKFSYNRMRYITEEKYQKLKRYTVKPLDVIITIMGTVGRSAVIPKDIPLAINTKHLACLTLKDELADPYFLANAFQIHPELIAQMHMNSKGAIMDGLNLTIIKHLRFKLPPLELQKSFAAFVYDTGEPKFKIQQSINKLQLLFDSLMQKYFG